MDPKTLTPQKPTVEKVRPYPRKWETHTMSRIKEVTLISSPIIPNCEIQHKAPAIVFSAGELTGNIFHDFNDGFIPLFITEYSICPDQDVLLVTSKARDLWVSKFTEILRTFTKYPIINLDNDIIIHCFPSANVVIISHDLITINPKLIPNSKAFTHFHALIDKAYGQNQKQKQNHPFKFNPSKSRPILVLISCNGRVGRVLLNQNEVKFEAEKIGFNVIIFKPTPMTLMHKAYELIHSSHAIIGIHGAALTHTIFLRPGSVFMQVVPLGTEWAAEVCYARLARNVGSEYMEYRIETEESSLIEKYSKDDLVIRDPVGFRGTGWSLMNVYLKE
ncbi:egf domain-specific o-linked n-acetylglucosamine transferase [Quercus suber]|uniref:Egf domain-specific o-linked n-acetylglucosamine transferase n=1 Tax=Quercus suber TaxID=58331 RepID=A0AAW0LEH2_QUESU